VSARLLGAPARDGHLVAWSCAPAVAATPCARVGGAVRVDAAGPAGGVFVLAASPIACELPLPPWGMLRIGPSPLWELLSLVPFAAGGPHASLWPLPGDPALAGASLHFQAFAVDGAAAVLTNRASTRLR
jgi:hypothetical protein